MYCDSSDSEQETLRKPDKLTYIAAQVNILSLPPHVGQLFSPYILQHNWYRVNHPLRECVRHICVWHRDKDDCLEYSCNYSDWKLTDSTALLFWKHAVPILILIHQSHLNTATVHTWTHKLGQLIHYPSVSIGKTTASHNALHSSVLLTHISAHAYSHHHAKGTKEHLSCNTPNLFYNIYTRTEIPTYTSYKIHAEPDLLNSKMRMQNNSTCTFIKFKNVQVGQYHVHILEFNISRSSCIFYDTQVEISTRV